MCWNIIFLIKYYCKNNAGSVQSINDAGFEMYLNPDLKIAGFKSGFGFEQFWGSGFGFGFGFDLDLKLPDLCPSLIPTNLKKALIIS